MSDATVEIKEEVHEYQAEMKQLLDQIKGCTSDYQPIHQITEVHFYHNPSFAAPNDQQHG